MCTWNLKLTHRVGEFLLVQQVYGWLAQLPHNFLVRHSQCIQTSSLIEYTSECDF